MSGSTPLPSPTPLATIVRVVLFWIAYLGILWLAALPKSMVAAPWDQLVWGLASIPLLLFLTARLAAREGRTLRELRVAPARHSAFRILGGLSIGALNYLLMIVAISALISPIRFSRVDTVEWGTIAVSALAIGTLAWMEELGFRGYPFRTLLAGIGPWRAQIVVALAFGLGHIAFGWDWRQVASGVLPSALLFGALSQTSGGLAMPTGAHAAMNLARLATGETATAGLWTVAIDEWSAGPLATWAPLVGLSVTLLTTCAIWGWHRHSLTRPKDPQAERTLR